MIMSKDKIGNGVVHRVPADLRNILIADKVVLSIWSTVL